MKIACSIKRPQGTTVQLDGTSYVFKPDAEGVHVCDVEDELHIKIFLDIPEAYFEAANGGPPKKAELPKKAEVPAPRMILVGDEAVDVDKLTHDQLKVLAEQLVADGDKYKSVDRDKAKALRVGNPKKQELATRLFEFLAVPN